MSSEICKLSKSADVSLAHYMKYQLGFPIYRNTKVTYFPSGDKKFHQMVRELQKAEKYIFLEYFIVEEGYMWEYDPGDSESKGKRGRGSPFYV